MSRGNVTIKTRSPSSIEGSQSKSEKLHFFSNCLPSDSITKLDGKRHEMVFLVKVELFARSSTSFNWAQNEKPQFSHLRFNQFYFKTFNWAQKERPQFSHLRLAQLCWALEQRLDQRLHCFLLRQEWKILIATRKCLFYRLNSGKLP